MRRLITICAALIALGTFMGATSASAGAHHRAIPAPLLCSNGNVDYGVGSLTVSTDWESNGCNWQIRPCLRDASNTKRCGGWVRAVELVSTTPQAYGAISQGWLETRSGSGTQVWCWNVTVPVSTSWYKCSA